MSEAKIKSMAKMSFNINLILSEEEAKALYQITAYSPDHFVKWFYKNLGKHYLQPHEDGLRSLFLTVQKELPQHIRHIDNSKKYWSENKPKPVITYTEQ